MDKGGRGVPRPYTGGLLEEFVFVRLSLYISFCLSVCICVYVCARCYCKASRVLEQYQHMPSFHGIQQDCQLIVEQLRARLKQQFHVRNVRSSVYCNVVSALAAVGLHMYDLCFLSDILPALFFMLLCFLKLLILMFCFFNRDFV